MRQFLRESWELWYWSLFCPSKLQQRMNEWAPAPKQDGRQPDTASLYILLFDFHTRFASQIIFLLTLFTLPLAASITLQGQAGEWVLIISALLGGYGLASWFLPAGIHLPLLFSLVYLLQPTPLREALTATWDLLLPLSSLLWSLGIGGGALALTTLGGYTAFRAQRLQVGRLIFTVGAGASVALAGWLTGLLAK